MYSDINKKLKHLKPRIKQRKQLQHELNLIFAEIQNLENQEYPDTKRINDLKLVHENSLSKLDNVNKLCNEYSDFIKEKELLVKLSSHGFIPELQNLDKSLEKLISANENLSDSIISAREMLNEVTRLVRELSKAKNWGITDLIGGFLINKQSKQSHIRTANELVSNINRLKDKHHNQMEKITFEGDLNVKFGNSTFLIDTFFNDIFTEWNLLSRISTSLENSVELKEILEKHLLKLEKTESKLEKEIEKIKMKKINLIEEI